MADCESSGSLVGPSHSWPLSPRLRYRHTRLVTQAVDLGVNYIVIKAPIPDLFIEIDVLFLKVTGENVMGIFNYFFNYIMQLFNPNYSLQVINKVYVIS